MTATDACVKRAVRRQIDIREKAADRISTPIVTCAWLAT